MALTCPFCTTIWPFGTVRMPQTNDGTHSELRTTKLNSKKRRAPSLRRSYLESRRMSGDSDDVQMLLDALVQAPMAARTIPDSATSYGPYLAPTTEFVLAAPSTNMDTPFAYAQDESRVRAILAFLSDPEKSRTCAATRKVETPDYCTVMDSEAVGKTRGASAPVDSTSDAVYAELHAKQERAEKRLRRMEKEALVRDRRRAIERVERIQQVDIVKLLPVLEARQDPRARRSHADLLEHLSCTHARILAEAQAILDRYNKLLPNETRHDDKTEGVTQCARRMRSSTAVSRSTHPRTSIPPRSAAASLERLASSRQSRQQMAPSLAELALHTDTHSSSRRPVSMRRKSMLAFGEYMPEFAIRSEPFEHAMASWLQSNTT